MNKQLTLAQYEHILDLMYLIRETELGIARRYTDGMMRCPTHLSVGQECTPAVLSLLLDQHHDQAVSTHRAHAHYLAKGGDLRALIAELHGKATGCSGGYGGSMHLIDEAVGFMGSTAIVGGTIPVGVGLALGKKIKSESGRVVVYLGDGAIEEGSFYESANFAAVRALRVLFVCEDNGYSVYSPMSSRQPEAREIIQVSQGIGLASWAGQGNDIDDTYAVLRAAIDYMDAENRPAFVSLQTYRWLEHCGPHCDDHLGYRSAHEVRAWKAQDPIKRLELRLLDQHQADAQSLQSRLASVRARVQDAFDFAADSPFPHCERPTDLVYA